MTDTLTHSGIILTDISDHFGVFSLFQKASHSKCTQNIEYTWSISPEKIAIFKENLSLCDFSRVYESNEVDVAYDEFYQCFKTIYNQSFPISMIKKAKKSMLKRNHESVKVFYIHHCITLSS